MPKYYFDVFDGVEMLTDTAGDDFETDKAAADQAVSLIPQLANDHIPKRHDLTVATSLRDDNGRVIHRSIGLVRSHWSEFQDPDFTVNIQQIRHSLSDSRRLRHELQVLREKIRGNIDGIFSTLERLASLSDVREGYMRGKSDI